MKRLYLLRHAKSDRSIPGLDDFDRPLTPRGERQIQEMGRFLKKRKMIPQRICSSPAKRALKTAEGIAGIIGFPAAKIKTVDAMYSSSVETLLKIIHKTDDDVYDLMLVGHNPEFGDLAGDLADHRPDSFPTCGLLCLDFDAGSWSQVSPGQGKMVFFEHPKKEEG